MSHRNGRAALLPLAMVGVLAVLPAQGEIAPTLLQAPAADAATIAARTAGAAAAVAQRGDAVVHVVVEVFGTDGTFPYVRPSTGLVVAPEGLVVTWWSLVQEVQGADHKRLFVQLAGRAAARWPATLVAHDEASGLALLQVQAPPRMVALELAPAPPRPGEPTLVLACPDGKEHVAFAGVASAPQAGILNRGQPLGPDGFLLTDARIDLRCDGAACIDAHGRLAGICSTEHVRRNLGEPTKDDLKKPTFGFVLPAARIRAAFPAHLAAPVAAAPEPAGAAAVVARVARSVVSVWGGEGPLPEPGAEDPFAAARRPGLGSGVVLSRNGLVVTNRHLLGSAGRARVALADGRALPARLVKGHAASNLALLQVELPAGTTLEPLACGDGEPILGETVLGIGNPLARAPTVTAGVLSALREGGLVQADPNLGNENGGGALVDLSGRLVAIVDGGVVDKIDRAFAMQGSDARVETNLGFCVGIGTVRSLFAAAIDDGAAEGESVLRPTPATAAERALREGPVARAVARAAPAMLNVYVSRVTTPVGAEDNPFAEHKPVRTAGESLGSGVILDRQGLAVTNWHVVAAATEPDGSARKDHVVQVRRFDGRSFDARVLSISREADLALLQLVLPDGETVAPVELGDSGALGIGETVIAIGNPHGHDNTITAGIVTAKDQSIPVGGRWANLEHLIETDAAINGGNSGGALIDLAGRLVGINTASGKATDVRGFAIQVDIVRERVLGLLLTEEKLRSPALGLHVRDAGGRVVVHALADDGPAARAGLAVGDVVLALDGTPITWTPGHARTLLGKVPGQPVTVRRERDGKAADVAVVPLAAPVWAVFRQCGIELAELPFQQDPDTVRAAWVALHRRFREDSKAEPASIPELALRIAHLKPALAAQGRLQVGDLLLAAELPKASAVGVEFEQRRFLAVADVFGLFQDLELGSLDGARFRCLIARGGAIVQVEVEARRLFW